MPIWHHSDSRTNASVLDEAFRNYEYCLYCGDGMIPLAGGRYSDELFVCPSCGWWAVFGYREAEFQGQSYTAYAGVIGSLANLHLADQTLPLTEIRQFLTARYADRNAVPPRVFEEIVASVYSDIGFDAQAVGRSGDGGIDVVLQNSAGERVGVQVKRTQNTITVEQIRALVGALVIGGFTRGVFVTTSRFTSGAPDLVNTSAARGVPVELVDADTFFDQLKIAQRTHRYTIGDADAPWRGAPIFAFRPIMKHDPALTALITRDVQDRH